MHPTSSYPPLRRSIFVAPSSTVLVHHVTAEWETLRLRETVLFRRITECDELKNRVNSSFAAEPRGGEFDGNS